jgi:hypothetical protein
MKMIIIAVVAALLPTLLAAAELPKKSTEPRRSASQRPVTGNPCAAYGAGFVKVEGSSTCIKVGGSVRVEAGGSH